LRLRRPGLCLWLRFDRLCVFRVLREIGLLLLIALDQVRRHTSRHARHAFREDRLALARKLLLGIEEVRAEQVRRIETRKIIHALAGGERQVQRQQRRDEKHARNTLHGPAPQLLASGAASAISLSTRLRVAAGVSGSLDIASLQRLSAATSLARQAATA